MINAHDGFTDNIDCGPGIDMVYADDGKFIKDNLKDCEQVNPG